MTDPQNGYVVEDADYNYTPLFSVSQGKLNIGAPIEKKTLLATFGYTGLITQLPNPNLNNELVLPQLQVGGTMMANDLFLGSNGTTKFISDGTGTYIYNNLSVSGSINNTDLIS